MPVQQKGNEGRYIAEDELDKLLTQGTVYYGNRICPFAHRAWWAAKEVGFESKMDYIHIELGEKKPIWYSSVNMFGTVPCLYVNGHRICESLIVAEYMNEEMSGQLMPKEPAQRADCRLLIQMFGDRVTGNLYRVLRTIDPQANKKEWEATKHALEEYDCIYRQLKDQDGPYFLGKSLSMVEIAIMPFFARFVPILKAYRGINLFEEAHIPGLKTAYEHVQQRQAFKETLMTPEEFIEFYKEYAMGSKAIHPQSTAQESKPSGNAPNMRDAAMVVAVVAVAAGLFYTLTRK